MTAERFRAILDGRLPPPPVADLVGMRLTAMEEGTATFELDADKRHLSPLGTLQGGILCVLADGAMGAAYVSRLADDETFATLELKMNYLKPVWTGRVVATAEVVKAGRTDRARRVPHHRRERLARRPLDIDLHDPSRRGGDRPLMEYRNLGRTGMEVSPLCLGAMMFGAWGNRDHDESIRIIHRALDGGINFIDTADVYAQGESEEIVGKALEGRREHVILATKVHGRMGEGRNRSGTRAAGSSTRSSSRSAACERTGSTCTRSTGPSPTPTSTRRSAR